MHPIVENTALLIAPAPHIEDLEEYSCHYILGVKEGDHKFLFQYVRLFLKTLSALILNEKVVKIL
jgi:hypothetical protein